MIAWPENALPTIQAGKTNMIRAIAAASFAGVVALIIALGSWYTVDQTERGVLLRNGAVVTAFVVWCQSEWLRGITVNEQNQC